jgi:cardiolipin synthase
VTTPDVSPGAPDAQWFRVEGSDVRLLRDGAEMFPLVFEALASARREIVAEYYWIAGVVGARFRDALAAAASRGVDVRIVFDSLGSRAAGEDWWNPLLDAGGRVREYNSILPFHETFRLERLGQRDHRKLLVVDGELGFTGGINLGDEWAPTGEGGGGWRDYAIAARGDVAREMRFLVYRTWHRLTGEDMPDDLARMPWSPERTAYMVASQRRRRRSIYREYRARIAAARTSIDLAHAYFYPDMKLRLALYAAAARGVRVRVLVPLVSDVPGLQLLVEATFPALLERGIEIYVMPPPMLHSKIAIFDESVVTLGSYNLDEGLRRNLEANVVIADAAFASHATRCFERDLADASVVDRDLLDKRSLFRRGAEWLALGVRGLW